MIAVRFLNARLLIALLAMAGIALAAVFAVSMRTEAATFAPFGTACLDDEGTVDPDPFTAGSPGECDGDNAPGANSSITTTFGVGPTDSNFGAVVAFTPPEWGVAKDADVEDGTLVARLSSLATLGLLNGNCSTSLPVGFDMFEATTNQADTVMFNVPPLAANFNVEQFEVVNGVPRGATEYPDYLVRGLTDGANGTGNTLQPMARLYGQTSVSGVPVSLNFVLLDKGGVTIRGTAFSGNLGYPSVTVLQNGGDPDIAPAPSTITDFCSPLKTSTTTFGTAGGVDVRTNPAAAGTYNFIVFSVDQRDADGDGFENSLDTCPYDPNPEWDPRSAAGPGDPVPGDSDKDGIGDICDPLPNDLGNPEGGATNDHDGDVYYNRQDNCPLIKNNLGQPFAESGGPDNQADDDNDGIGNACDRNLGNADADGAQTVKCIVSTIDIGGGGTAGFTDYTPCGARQEEGGGGASPTPTLPPGATPRPTTAAQGGVAGGPVSGVGSLSPDGSTLPLWAVALAGVAVVGLITGTTMVVRVRRDDE
ncbi:MAG: thrombospondin type 3 repeat-containing protein [Dehalococcoidia bacterium]